jgi:hypothetical protein
MSDLNKVLEAMRTENSMVDWVGNRVVYMSLVFKIILYNLVGGK